MDLASFSPSPLPSYARCAGPQSAVMLDVLAGVLDANPCDPTNDVTSQLGKPPPHGTLKDQACTMYTMHSRPFHHAPMWRGKRCACVTPDL